MKGSLKKRGKHWYAIFDAPTADGKRNQKWINTKCEKKIDAEKKLREMLSKIDNNSFISPEKITFTDFLIDFIDNIIKTKIEITTWESYHMMTHTHIVPYFKSMNIKLQELTPIQLQKYFDYKFKEGRSDKKGGLSANTLRKHLACMSSALNYAVRMNLITYNPLERVILPKKENFIGKFYSAEQIELLINAVHKTPIEVAVILTVHYGLRRSEVLALTWKDIDFKEETITIDKARVKIKGGDTVKSTKTTSSTRTLPLINNIGLYLKNKKNEYQKIKKFVGESLSETDYICCTENGIPISPDYLSKAFKKIIKVNNLEDIRFHDLRHSTASFLLKQGLSLKEIQTWLGHGSISTSMNIYSHMDMEMKKNAAKSLNNLSGHILE